MGSPLVSILLPSLNARQFLGARIESLLAQTFNDWEAIVLDSQSTDGSWELFNSTAATDPRFRLIRIPREGLYAALNSGMQMARGAFLHFAPCDDTMAPEFFAEMLEAFAQCPDAGIAACDALLINQDGDELSAEDLTGRLSMRAIRNLLGSGAVPTAFPEERERSTNYRSPPHDCLLHFTGRSVYFSLTQLVVRTALAKEAGPFETTVGSVADFGWLLRLTNLTGTVHVPKKLATWRFHGDQLSVQKDDSRLTSMKRMCVRILPEICQRHPDLLTSNDRAALLLSCKTFVANSVTERVYFWLETVVRLFYMLFERPAVTLRTLHRTRFRAGTRENSLVPMILQGIGLTPEKLEAIGNPEEHDDFSTAGRQRRA
jgi:glycosyltransferase involved in cell wall biosynthesis